jgi:trehalose 6-phosphate phosphatase
MRPLWSDEGGRRLDEAVRAPLLCAFDFDGTLAPIVKDPERAIMPEDVARLLAILSSLTAVAIITGRSLADLRKRLDFEPHYLVGNHGIEGIPAWAGRREEYERICREWEAVLTTLFDKNAAFDRDIWIENKGCSLSVHYRMARERETTEARLRRLFTELLPEAHVIAGKCVFNLLPPGAPHKGSAFEHIFATSGACSALYVGDDITDEDVFRLRRPNLLKVRIEREVDSEAEFYLHHQIDMVQLLEALITRLSQE